MYFLLNHAFLMLNRRENIEWLVSKGLTPYPQAVTAMKQQVDDLYRNPNTPERVWLLEHPPLYTAGVSAKSDEVLDLNRFPIYKTGRGGKMTYHGPGQRVIYLMLNLSQRGKDVRRFVNQLEEWIILTLASFDLHGQRRPDQTGIWIKDQKIAAIGIRLSHWISSHGISINLSPDLEHFSGIIPCGLQNENPTSIHALGRDVSMKQLDAALKASFAQAFDQANQISSQDHRSSNSAPIGRKSF